MCPTMQILKTKAAVLRRWCQENGLRCRSKDKKEDLVGAVAARVRQTGKAFSVTA